LNLVRSTRILSKFPGQIFILKSFVELAQLGPIDPNLRFEMVDWKLSRAFGELCAQIRKAGTGDQRMKAHFLQRAADAQRHLDLMRDNNPHLVQLIKVLRKHTGDDLLKARRREARMPGPDGVRLLKSMEYMAIRFSRNLKLAEPLPDDPALASRCLIFRLAIAIRLLALRWAEHGGGVADARPERLRNDFVDLTYGAVATYWDGFLTMDKKAFDIYSETEYLANDFFPRIVFTK
jgi:hypothetical protein